MKIVPQRPGPRLFRLLIVASIVACAARQDPPMVMSAPVRANLDSSDTAFFPPAVLRSYRTVYAEYLAAMGEPRLDRFADSADVAAVRFLWLRSFHVPMAVRLMRRGPAYALIAVQLGPPDRDRPGGLLRRDSIALDAGTWSQLTAPVASVHFWQPSAPIVGLDGARWVIESVTPGAYQVGDWWSPSKAHGTAHVRAFGVALLRRTRFDLGPIY